MQHIRAKITLTLLFILVLILEKDSKHLFDGAPTHRTSRPQV